MGGHASLILSLNVFCSESRLTLCFGFSGAPVSYTPMKSMPG